MSIKKRRSLGREELKRIIDLCRSVDIKGLNPFLVDVEDLVTIIKEYFPDWKETWDLCLDAEALNEIASVVNLQSEWVKHRATSLYMDPFLIEEKLHILKAENIAQIFLKIWHPLIEFEQISIHSIGEATKYWKSLLPLDERWQETSIVERELERATRKDLIEQKILAEESFSAELESLWEELKHKVGNYGKVRYWDFIGADTYQETVMRAYLTSFLITYGYATLEIYPLEEEIFIKPFEKPIPIQKMKQQLASFPISISLEEWVRWRENQGA